MLDPGSRPPLRPSPLLGLLAERDVEWVMTGSGVLVLYGARLRPHDLDVVPAPDDANLARLAAVLGELSAVPAHVPAWAGSLSLQECRDWTPWPATAENLDHAFVTTMGIVDIPPTLTGTYEQLRPNAARVQLNGVAVWACDPAEVLARLPARPRPKDVERASEYELVRAAIRAGEAARADLWSEVFAE